MGVAVVDDGASFKSQFLSRLLGFSGADVGKLFRIKSDGSVEWVTISQVVNIEQLVVDKINQLIDEGILIGGVTADFLNGGGATSAQTSSVDCGNASTTVWDLLFDGGSAYDGYVDGGLSGSAFSVTVDGGGATGTASDTMDGGNSGYSGPPIV